MNTLERSDWLESLWPGSPVVFLQPNFGPLNAKVLRMCQDRIWLTVESGIPIEPVFEAWVWRDTGNCPAAGISIQPIDAILPAIGAEPNDGRVGGWEAA